MRLGQSIEDARNVLQQTRSQLRDQLIQFDKIDNNEGRNNEGGNNEG